MKNHLNTTCERLQSIVDIITCVPIKMHTRPPLYSCPCQTTVSLGLIS